MRILFMGTPEFAVASLKRLVEDGHEICGVFTQPDRPKNRGHKLAFSPVKEYALSQGLTVYQPTKMRDGTALALVRELHPELIVVAAYGRILPQEILDRFSIRIEEAVPLDDGQMLIFFRNGAARKCDMRQLCTDRRFAPILQNARLFSAVQVQTDGYGITWGENLDVGADQLYREGMGIPLSIHDFQSYASSCITDTAGACKLLNCSRQNISDLVKRGKLHPLHTSSAGNLFLLSELRQRLWV